VGVLQYLYSYFQGGGPEVGRWMGNWTFVCVTTTEHCVIERREGAQSKLYECAKSLCVDIMVDELEGKIAAQE